MHNQLEWAIDRGDVEAVVEAVASGVEPRTLRIAAIRAYFQEQLGVLDYLLDQELPAETYQGLVVSAAGKGDLGRFRQFLGRAPPGIRLGPAMVAAAQGGRVDMLEVLVSGGADLEARSAFSSNTPLIAAAEGGHAEVVRFLAESGADLNATQHDGETALHRAAYYNRADVVAALLAVGADSALCNLEGETPLDVAKKARRRRVVDLLQGLIGA